MMITEKDIGRRVIVNGEVSRVNFHNDIGTIIEVNPEAIPMIGIKFDRQIMGLHDCGNMCKWGYGYYVHEHNITFKEDNMKGIRIETEKIVNDDGELVIKILSIKCLKKGKLPEIYLEGKEPIVYIYESDFYCENRKETLDQFYSIGELLTRNEFRDLLEHCHAAGDHLLAVNAELKAKKATWNGKETFII